MEFLTTLFTWTGALFWYCALVLLIARVVGINSRTERRKYEGLPQFDLLSDVCACGHNQRQHDAWPNGPCGCPEHEEGR